MYRCLIYVHGLLFISASVPLLRAVQSDSTYIFSITPCVNAGIPRFYYFKCNTLYSLYLFQCIRRILISAMFALLLSRTPKAGPQSKKPNKKGTPSKVFYGTRLKWGSCSSGGDILQAESALYTSDLVVLHFWIGFPLVQFCLFGAASWTETFVE